LFVSYKATKYKSENIAIILSKAKTELRVSCNPYPEHLNISQHFVFYKATKFQIAVILKFAFIAK